MASKLIGERRESFLHHETVRHRFQVNETEVKRALRAPSFHGGIPCGGRPLAPASRAPLGRSDLCAPNPSRTRQSHLFFPSSKICHRLCGSQTAAALPLPSRSAGAPARRRSYPSPPDPLPPLPFLPLPATPCPGGGKKSPSSAVATARPNEAAAVRELRRLQLR